MKESWGSITSVTTDYKKENKVKSINIKKKPKCWYGVSKNDNTALTAKKHNKNQSITIISSIYIYL